jgi:hypothetical protein
VAEGDKVVTRKVFTGVHRGPFAGVEATGRDVEIHVIDIVRVAGGRIVEHWNCVDRLGLMAQLTGPAAAEPAPGELAAAGPVLDGVSRPGTRAG